MCSAQSVTPDSNGAGRDLTRNAALAHTKPLLIAYDANTVSIVVDFGQHGFTVL